MGAFLLKGPVRFHPRKPTDLGKNGNQLDRRFNIPAQIYVVRHRYSIGAAVRKQAEAFALARSFVAPCQIVFMDGLTTARLMRAHELWPTNCLLQPHHKALLDTTSQAIAGGEATPGIHILPDEATL